MSKLAAKNVEFGVFLPVGNGGWIPSINSPRLSGSYDYNREVTLLAERYGFDFALSMAKWRGYGGETRHWDFTLESLTVMAALAEVTTRIKVWATVHTMVFHPAVVAKMAATIDQISGGRFGLNLVAGSNPSDQGQMGLWKPLDHRGRYALAEEWITVARRLWTEDRVDFTGEYFTLTDCVSDPKPAVPPFTICAATSETGFDFTIRNLDGCFIGAHDKEMVRIAQLAKSVARRLGPPTKTYALLTLVPGDTDADAQRRVDLYDKGVDTTALNRQAGEYSRDVKENTTARRMIQAAADQVAVTKSAIVRRPSTIADRIAALVHDGDLDGITIIVPDFITDLAVVAEEVIPMLADRGVLTNAALQVSRA